MIIKPWQVTLEYCEAIGFLTFRVREHTHGSIAFSNAAADYCGGALETDEDGYVIRCRDEVAAVDTAREIAIMSDANHLARLVSLV